MATKSPQVDDYVAKSADFAKPILNHLRALVHKACPDVEETIKWSHVFFMHKGMLCMMAAFKYHCSFGFWKHKLLFGADRPIGKNPEKGMGHLGRITSLSDLPPDKVLLGYIKEAIRLNEENIQTPRPARKAPKSLVIPPDLSAALKKNRKALETFGNFSPSHKREYVEWVTEAKREETRLKRLDTTIAWLAEGKPRNWKYMNC